MTKKKYLTLEQLMEKFEQHSLIYQKRIPENNEKFDLPAALKTMCIEIKKIKEILEEYEVD